MIIDHLGLASWGLLMQGWPISLMNSKFKPLSEIQLSVSIYNCFFVLLNHDKLSYAHGKTSFLFCRVTDYYLRFSILVAIIASPKQIPRRHTYDLHWHRTWSRSSLLINDGSKSSHLPAWVCIRDSSLGYSHWHHCNHYYEALMCSVATMHSITVVAQTSRLRLSSYFFSRQCL